MAKETHAIRVWARRGERRRLELSIDSPAARGRALVRVEALKSETDVDRIEMEEYVLLAGDADGRVPARRSTMRWARSGHGWRRLPDSRPSR